MYRLFLSAFAIALGLLPTAIAQPAAAAHPPSLWTLGIYTGPSPLQLSPPPVLKNPILRGSDVTDFNADTLAHPFMIVEGGRYYLYFTAKFHKTDEAGIGLAESRDGVNWQYKKLVVKEPYTLAHPFVFHWQHDYYMIPEAHKEKFVRLYRATHFPDEWKFEKNLFTGDTFISPTLVRYKDLWWMFILKSGNETLRLFYASDFKGPWTEHPMSPVIPKDLRTARPAGRPFVLDGKLYRLAQDCIPTYGYQVRAFEITDISPTTYAEKMIEKPLIKASGSGWNAEAMHHVDAHEIAKDRWIAAVDALGW